MKGCLKHLSAPCSGHKGLLSPRKTVVFECESSLEQVFMADEWDRTPTEPAKKLSYQDLLELKEIQLSLPRANQPADAVTGRSGSHYLSGVPIGLLPLLPETPTSTPSPKSPTPKPTTSPMSPSWASFTPNSRQCPLPTSPPLGGVDAVFRPPSYLSHLPPPQQPQAPKQKPRFAFLPLLDSAPRSRSPSPELTSDTDPPTPSLTNASLDSSPLSRASSCSPEPPFFQLPPPRQRPGFHEDEMSDTDGAYPAISSKFNNMHLQSRPNPPYGHRTSTSATTTASSNTISRPPLTRFVPPPPPPAPSRTPPSCSSKKNVIVVNGMEIELDDDDDDESDECSTPPATSFHQQHPRSPPSPSKALSLSPTNRSPPLRWQSTTNESSQSSPFSGLHAPVRFKRQVPSTKGDVCSSPISTSPPSPRPRRGSVCSPKIKSPHSPRSSPILMPRA